MAKNPFDFVTSINNHVRIDLDKQYDQFLVTRHFSHFIDSVMYAHEAATFNNMKNDLHYDYLFNSIGKKNRYLKWPKSVKDEEIEVISEYYDCSYEKAKELKTVLSEEAMNYIREWNQAIRKGE
jgi:hypothetical protein